MPHRPERERGGFCKVFLRGAETAFAIRANEYEPLTAALMAGGEWFECFDLYGDSVVLRLADVSSVMECSAGALVAYDADQDERIAWDQMHGSGS